MLCSVRDVTQVLSEVNRVLKPGGKVFLVRACSNRLLGLYSSWHRRPWTHLIGPTPPRSLHLSQLEHIASPEGTTMRRIQDFISPVWEIALDGCKFSEVRPHLFCHASNPNQLMAPSFTYPNTHTTLTTLSKTNK